MCQIWLRSDGRVERGGGTDRQRDTAALYSRWRWCLWVLMVLVVVFEVIVDGAGGSGNDGVGGCF